jgi:hypothetical protein
MDTQVPVSNKRLARLVNLQRNLGFASAYNRGEQDIDQKIYPLLLLMNFAGHQTTGSCSGHLNGRLKCWAKDQEADGLYHGYINIQNANHKEIRKLRNFIAEWSAEKLSEGDFFLHAEKRGVGLCFNLYTEGLRISWYLPTWKRVTRFITLLEQYYINMIKESNTKLAKAETSANLM